MVAVNPFLPVIILTVNELNSSIKRQSGRMDKLHDLFSFCNSISVQRVHLDSETQVSWKQKLAIDLKIICDLNNSYFSEVGWRYDKCIRVVRKSKEFF